MSDEESAEIVDDSLVETVKKAVELVPLEVKIVKEEKEFDELDHDDDEYQDMGITKEQLKDFEDDKEG